MIRRLVKGLVYLLCICGVLLVGLAALALQSEPRVAQMQAPTPQQVIEARTFVQSVRTAIDPASGAAAQVVTTADELGSVIKLGARIFPGFRGQVETVGNRVAVAASLPVSAFGVTRWINVSGAVPDFENGVVLSDVTLGPLPLPGEAVLAVGRFGANLVVGNGFGDTVLESARSLRIEDPNLVFVLRMDGVGSNGIMRGIFGSIRGQDMPQQDEIMRYYRSLRTAMDEGRLPSEGSYLPYVLFTLEAARNGAARDGAANAYTSAIFALALACGAQDFYLLTGGLADGAAISEMTWQTDCKDLRFNDRIDSRRHFTTAAALQAASNRGFAVSVGEFKELYDSVRKGGGFDFTDIAANNSGIRMSNRMMTVDPALWPDLIAMIETENDVIIPFDGVPQIMPEDEFVSRFGDVESAAYKAQLADIEARIDLLPLHR